MPRRVLITGVNGFTGRHLAAALTANPDELVLGTGRRAGSSVPLAGYQPCDLTDDASVRRLVAWAQPDVVFHLAGCWGHAAAADLDQVNIGGFERLHEALGQRALRRPVRMLVLGSAAEIGAVPSAALPACETIACRPPTAYGKSKHALVRAALARPDHAGIEIVVARPFNLVGAGLDRRLAPAAFAAAVRAVACGAAAAIHCGWLEGRRDYLDVADAVRAYRLLVDRAPTGTLANVCSGRSVRVGDLLQHLLALAGIEAPVMAAAAPGEHDVAEIVGSHATLSELTGWQPEVPLAASLAALYAETAG